MQKRQKNVKPSSHPDEIDAASRIAAHAEVRRAEEKLRRKIWETKLKIESAISKLLEKYVVLSSKNAYSSNFQFSKSDSLLKPEDVSKFIQRVEEDPTMPVLQIVKAR